MPLDDATVLEAFRHDYALYARSVQRIKNKDAQIIAFLLNRMQRKLWQWFAEDLLAGLPIRWMVLKMRQGGSSTFFELLLFWLVTMNANKNGLVTAHDKQSAQNLLSISNLCYKAAPERFKFKTKTSNRNELYFASREDMGGLESRIRVETADNKNLGASYTINYALFSEIARYQGLGIDVEKMMVSFNPTVPYRAGTAIIWETTAQGQEYFYKRWMDPKHSFRKIFCSFVANEEYRMEIEPTDYFDLSDNEDTHYGDEVYRKEKMREQVEIWYDDYDTHQQSHEVWCRLAWRRWAIDNLCEGSKENFDQEFPTTAEDAFLTSGVSFFDNKILGAMRLEVRDAQDRHDLIDVTKLRFNKDAYLSGQKNWHKNAFSFVGAGDLRVYKHPKKQRYLLCGDPTQGNSEEADEAAAHVLGFPDIQICATYAKILRPDEFADVLVALAYFYNEALIVLEVNGPGAETMRNIRERHRYTRIYRREVFDSIERKKQKKFGWVMGSTNKAIALGSLDRNTRLGTIALNDYKTIDEMLGFRRNPDGTFGHPKRADNRVTALAIGCYVAETQPGQIVSDGKDDMRGTLAEWEKLLDSDSKRGVTSRGYR